VFRPFTSTPAGMSVDQMFLLSTLVQDGCNRFPPEIQTSSPLSSEVIVRPLSSGPSSIVAAKKCTPGLKMRLAGLDVNERDA
jgi:hypothetical protein